MNHSKCEDMTHKNRNLFQISAINTSSGTQSVIKSLQFSDERQRLLTAVVTVNRHEISTSSSANRFGLGSVC